MWYEIIIGLILLLVQLFGISMAIYSIISSVFHGDFNSRIIIIFAVLFSVILPTYVAYTSGIINSSNGCYSIKNDII